MRSLPKTFWPSCRRDAETVPSPPSNTATLNIWFTRTIGSDTQERKKDSDAIIHDIESSSGVTLTDNTVQELFADKTEAAVGAHALDPSTQSDILNDTLDIEAINLVTSQAKKPKFKH